MDVWRITVAALRRWYVLLPLLALTGLAAYAAGNGVQPEYDSTGSAMVVPGQSAPTIPNPYGNVEDANTVLGIVLSGPETRSQIAAHGLSPSFEVTAMTRSTILNFSVRADESEVAVGTGQTILEHAAAELESRQEAAGVPVNERYTLDVLQAPALTAVVTEGKLRNMAIIGVIGAAGSLVVAVLFDDIVGLVRRRRNRKKSSATDDSTSGGGLDETAAIPPGAGDDLDLDAVAARDEPNLDELTNGSDKVELSSDEARDDDRALAVHDSR